MKLDEWKFESALKLYIGLYFLAFFMTWLVSIPMIVHVSPKSECWLFITPRMEYGPSSVCLFIGYGSLVAGILAFALLVWNCVQLYKLKRFFRQPGSNRSADYKERQVHIFWRVVKVHVVVNVLLLIIVAVVTAGYATTCEHLQREVSLFVQKRFEISQYGFQDNSDRTEKFADDSSYRRYTNRGIDAYGRDSYNQRITCRKALMDPINHLKIKRNQDNSQRIIYGVYEGSDEYTDRGNLASDTYRGNLTLEMSLAGSWIGLSIWTLLLILMLLKRHHIKARLTDASLYGSEFGSVRSSRKSGSRYSGGSQGRKSDHNSYRSAAPPSIIPYDDRTESYLKTVRNPHPHDKIETFRNSLLDNSCQEFDPQNITSNSEIDVDAAIMEDSGGAYIPQQDIDLCQSVDEDGYNARSNVQRYLVDSHQVPSIRIENFDNRESPSYNQSKVPGRRAERMRNITMQSPPL